MSAPDQPDLTPEDSPESQDAVRRLLAEARHTEPMPAEVAERLDRVLGHLGQSPAPGPAERPVVDLATRRRRRNVSALLVAAAAVVVIGVGVGQLVPMGDGDDATSQSAPAEDDRGAAADAQTNREQAPEAAPSTIDPSVQPQRAVELLRVGRNTFADDVARYQRRFATFKYSPDRQGRVVTPPFPPEVVCEPADWGTGRLVAASYAGTPVVLAYRPPLKDTQVVDLMQCGTGDVLRSTTLPAR